MENKISLSQIMTREVVSIHPDDNMEIVERIFNTHDFHHIPVLDKEEKIVGMISKSDYLLLSHGLPLFRKEIEQSNNHDFFRAVKVREVMSKQLMTLGPEDPLTLAAGLFNENLYHAIPIVDAEGKFVGLVTTIDLINYAFPQPELIIKED